jgi:hypothetical protein
MYEILLDEQQHSVISQSPASVQVRGPSGALVGYLVPNGKPSSQNRADQWIDCWNEWYLETEEAELQQA